MAIAMFSVGEALRRARLDQGLDLSTVAASTKINAKYLEAIEADDRKSLPSSFFYRSFVHQYALALSLDTLEIDAEVERILSEDAPLPLPGQESPVARDVAPVPIAPRFQWARWYTSVATLTVVVVGCSAFYAWWHDFRAVGVAKSPPVTLTAENAKPVVPTNSPPAPQPAQVPKPDEKADPNEIADPEAVPTPPVPSPLAAAIEPPAAPPPPSNPAVASIKVLLDLIARERTWLSISSDGRRVFSGFLRPNESKTVEGKEFAKMVVGNAAGLEVRLNGKLLGPLGARGQVLTVVFTADSFQIVTAPREGD